MPRRPYPPIITGDTTPLFDQIPVFPKDHPVVRPLDVMPVMAQGQQLIMVRDPLNVMPGPALLVPDPMLMFFLEMADGKTSLGEMAQKLTMLTGQIISSGHFESMADQLDEALMLQSQRFVDALKQKYEEFMASPTRPYRVFQAPTGMDRLKMMKELGDEFRRHKMSSVSPPERLDLPAGSVVGVLSPHIDYQRGGEAYAWAYQALKQCGTGADTYIVLGTSHRPMAHRFAATRKDYDTPLGLVETNKELLEEIAREFGGDLFSEEYIHADEHAIELQATYLKHTFQDRTPKIVPILVGSIEDMLEEEGSPQRDEEVAAFAKALRTVLERHGDKVGIIGGVDFSHCGPAFGDEDTNEPEREKSIEAADRAALAAIEKGEPDAYFDVYRHDLNANRVCSIAPIYITMEALRGRAKAKTLAYQQSNSSDKSTLVSFASVAFVKEGVEAAPKSRIILVSR